MYLKQICSHWKTTILKWILVEYESDNAFNILTANFIKCLPNKTITFKDDNCFATKYIYLLFFNGFILI